jgi:hypothetical protein
MLAHAHELHHDEAGSIPLQEQKQGETHGLLDHNTNQNRENVVQHVEYNIQSQDDWRTNHRAITNYKISDLQKHEPLANAGHGTSFGDIFIH